MHSPFFDAMESQAQINITCENAEIGEACIILKSFANHDIQFQYQNLQCDNCLLMGSNSLKPHHMEKIILDFVLFGTTWQVINVENNNSICSGTNYMGENSWFTLAVNDTHCQLIEDKVADDVYKPIITAFSIYLCLAALWIIGKFMYRKQIFSNLFRRPSEDDLALVYSTSSTIEDKKQKQFRQRLRSIDTVRGISIVLMIFVNYGGGKYWFFHHIPWNGITIADVVFPWFMWLMGMSAALSLRSQLRKSVPRKKILWKIFKRSLILFALGVILNSHCTVLDLQEIRILGVLQRFGISYFVVATLHLCFENPEDTNQDARWAPLRDIALYWIEWIVMIGLLATHIFVTFFLPVPGCPSGYLGPGGIHDGGNFSLCTGGAAGYIDRIILGTNHLYQNPSFKKIYHTTLPYDPEGILGYLTSIFLVFLGLQAGKILLTYQDWKGRIARWMSWSLFTGVVAMLLTKVSKSDGWIPLNKNLWSVSFIFATASLAFILISVCHYLVDVKKWWSGSPFFYSGMNSILLYVGHEITHNMFPWSWQVEHTHKNELIIDLWGTSLWVLISLWMYHIDFFVAL